MNDEIIKALTNRVTDIIRTYYTTSMKLEGYVELTDKVRNFIQEFAEYGLIDWQDVEALQKKIFDNAYEVYKNEGKRI